MAEDIIDKIDSRRRERGMFALALGTAAVAVAGALITIGVTYSEIKNHTEDISAIKAVLPSISTESRLHDARIRTLEERSRIIDDKMERVTDDVAEIKGDIKVLLRRIPR